ncbi:PQQ-binding-like beta-propeller repeat protein [Pedosphaera parvula]|uniref:Pyrrolo-quinoline quinone n=1 Tax=Pedosphaera parvula (strain Ellin514) TaxID=320771 RepID=B9XR64_PEDPL|nr:PQQ-binding-like beta-propeller repeat protein [Pedosphaera parvula]EEF57677.1 Pyrrolo-quinoline quinone [Pedosphaera parvula Ellin514]
MKRFADKLVLLALVAQSALAADWPQWRGPERTGHVPPGEVVPVSLPQEPKVTWRIKVGDGLSSPVIAAGKVFYSDAQEGQETLHALEAGSGKELWRVPIAPLFKDNQTAAAPRCTPVVDGDRVYAQSCTGEFKCLDVSSGKQLWQTSFTRDFGAVFIGEKGNAQGATRHGYNAAPVVDGDLIFATVGSTNGASVVGFEKKTGKMIWKSQNDVPAYAAPIVATIEGRKQLVVFTAEGVIGLELKEGKLLWRGPLKTTFGRHITTPVIFENMVVVSSHELGLIGIHVAKEGDGFKASEQWRKKESAINISSPVAAGQYLYGLGPQRNLICVDIKTGKEMWSKEGYISTSAGNASAAFIVMDKNILTLTDGGQLVMFAADCMEFKEISNVQVCGKTWCNPAYADGKLYLRDGRELYCVELIR